MCNKDNNAYCGALTIISSLLGAAGIAAVFYTGIVTTITALTVITLVFGIISLLTLIISIYCNTDEGCYCTSKNCLVPTLVGSIITSIFALTITTVATFSIPVAILIGSVAFFLISNLINLIRTIICMICIRKCR